MPAFQPHSEFVFGRVLGCILRTIAFMYSYRRVRPVSLPSRCLDRCTASVWIVSCTIARRPQFHCNCMYYGHLVGVTLRNHQAVAAELASESVCSPAARCVECEYHTACGMNVRAETMIKAGNVSLTSDEGQEGGAGIRAVERGGQPTARRVPSIPTPVQASTNI